VHDVDQSDVLFVLPQLSVDLGDDRLHPCWTQLLLEHLLEDSEDHFELLVGALGHLQVDSVGDAVRPLTHSIHEFNEFPKLFLGQLTHLIYFTVQNFVTAEVGSVLEKIDFEITGRIEVLHLNVKGIAFSRFCCLTGLFVRKILNDAVELSFHFQNGLIFSEGIHPEILNEQLGHDVEVLLIVMEDVLDQGEYLLDVF
jgi:hypothetical protein